MKNWGCCHKKVRFSSGLCDSICIKTKQINKMNGKLWVMLFTVGVASGEMVYSIPRSQFITTTPLCFTLGNLRPDSFYFLLFCFVQTHCVGQRPFSRRWFADKQRNNHQIVVDFRMLRVEKGWFCKKVVVYKGIYIYTSTKQYNTLVMTSLILVIMLFDISFFY